MRHDTIARYIIYIIYSSKIIRVSGSWEMSYYAAENTFIYYALLFGINGSFILYRYRFFGHWYLQLYRFTR